MLDDNAHAGLGSFAATLVDTWDDGPRVSSGPWKACRQAAPRHGAIVAAAADQTLGSWGPPTVEEAVEASQWPRGYGARHEMQARSGKGMIDHGGLDIHCGHKTIRGPDRHHQRQKEPLAQALETAHPRVDKKAEAVTAPQAKVAESEAKGHGTRLAQRQRTLGTLEQALKDAKGHQAKRSEQAVALGPAGQRADRDFRQQTSMTMRPLWLENLLRAFRGALVVGRQIQVSVEQVLRLVFERRGARMETPSQVVYWGNSAGLSLAKRRLLGEIVEGLCAMDLQEKGQPIHVCLTDMLP